VIGLSYFGYNPELHITYSTLIQHLESVLQSTAKLLVSAKLAKSDFGQ